MLAADLGLTTGFKSIIFGLYSGRLYVVKRDGPTSWSVATGWPVQLPAHVYSSPAVGNLDGDPEPEIVVGYGSTFDNTDGQPNHGGARAYNRDGSLLWEVLTGDITPGPADGFRDPVMSTPAIGDVDGDGSPEVVFGALDHKLYVVNGENGQSNNGAIWPKDMQDTVFSSPALHNLDGLGGLEIIIGTDAFMINGGRLRVIRGDGTDYAGFEGGKPIDQVVSGSPSVGNIDSDPQPEIVHGTGRFFTDANNGPNPAPLHRVYAWNCDGTAVAGWPAATTGQVIGSPALANLDADSELEVIVTADNTATPSEFRLYAFNGNGTPIFATVVRDFFGASLSAGEPIVADVLDDQAGAPNLANTDIEILVATNGEVAVFDRLGNQMTETDNFPDDASRPNLMTQDSLAGVAVTDLETNLAGNQIEVIAVSARDFPTQTTTVVHVWNPISRTSVPPWGLYRQDEKRRGVAPGTPACGSAAACIPSSTAADFFTVTPCRTLDTRPSSALLSSSPRTIAIGCGVPGTAKAVAVNVTVTQPTATGFVRFAPGGCTALPVTSTINFSGGQTRANNAVLPLAIDGSATLVAEAFVLAGGSVHLLVDVTGYFQ